MNIVGEKTILRAIEPKDTALLLEIINDPQTEKMLGGKSAPVSFEGQKAWILGQSNRSDILRCMITEKGGNDDGLGTIILSDIDYQNGIAQIHIKMGLKNCRGKGYGTDALRTIVQYAFNEIRLNCLYAEVLEYNSSSQKIFEKCGFHRDGRLRARAYKNGSFYDVYSYSLLYGESRL